MNILVNFIPIVKGGGLQNALNFWKTCTKLGTDDNWICLTRKNSEISKLPHDESHTIIEIPVSTNYLMRIIIDNLLIRKYVKMYNADVVFTLAGPGPLFGKFKKVNGWHEPYLVYPESVVWEKMSIFSKSVIKLKYLYAKKVLRNADVVTVQTETMKGRIIKYVDMDPSKIHIIPNGISTYSEESYLSSKKKKMFSQIRNKIKLLVLSELYLHKNFEYLIDLAKLLPDKYVFVISIDHKSGIFERQFIQKVFQSGVKDYFVFIGNVAHNEIKTIYKNSDAIFLPTILESFSANYVEALYFEKPIFTSDMDFSREICKDLGIYFDPFDPKSGYYVLENFFNNPDVQKEYYHKLKNTNIKYPDWEDRFTSYETVIKN